MISTSLEMVKSLTVCIVKISRSERYAAETSSEEQEYFQVPRGIY